MSATENVSVVDKLRDELARLLDYVEMTKTGLQCIENTVVVGSQTVPEASVQINTVTGDLENAANTIMTILEEVLEEHDRSSALLAKLTEWAGGLAEDDRAKGTKLISSISEIQESTKKKMMEIFTNMSFHDLSGQKLKKVNTSLSVVETKLVEIAKNFGIKKADNGNGKAHVAEVMDQDIVDKLLKEIGG